MDRALSDCTVILVSSFSFRNMSVTNFTFQYGKFDNSAIDFNNYVWRILSLINFDCFNSYSSPSLRYLNVELAKNPVIFYYVSISEHGIRHHIRYFVSSYISSVNVLWIQVIDSRIFIDFFLCTCNIKVIFSLFKLEVDSKKTILHVLYCIM